MQVLQKSVPSHATARVRSGPKHAIVAAIAALAVASTARAADVTVRVEGIEAPFGQIGCALFSKSAASDFLMDNNAARVMWLGANLQGVTCRFAEIPAGTYAIGVSHDVNGNKKPDTNFLGIPIEQWGVSNNIRPKLRAPRFDEAAFQVSVDSNEIALDIKVAK